MIYFLFWFYNFYLDGCEIDYDGRRCCFLYNFEFGYFLRCVEIKKSIL